MSNKRKTLSDIENEDIGVEHSNKEFPIVSVNPRNLEAREGNQRSGISSEGSEQVLLQELPSAFRLTSRDINKEQRIMNSVNQERVNLGTAMSSGPSSTISKTTTTVSEDTNMEISQRSESIQSVDSDDSEASTTIVPIDRRVIVQPMSVGPMRLDKLPQEVLERILSHIMPVNRTIKPWFRFCMRLSGNTEGGDSDAGITWIPNVDSTFFLVNKACHEIGTTILYGSNHFRFCYIERTDCAKWWMKRIGDRNLSKVKKMTFLLNSGWTLGGTRRPSAANPSHNSHEEDWLNALGHVIHRKVKLDYLRVETLYWDDLRDNKDYDDDAKYELNKSRKLIVDLLCKFRGVRKAEIKQLGKQWIGEDSKKLTLLMQQPLWTLHEPPVPKLSFPELLEYCKAKNLLKMKRIEEGIRAKQGG